MIPTSEIFRRYNFLLLNNILDNGDNIIQAKEFINPNDDIFNQPLKKINHL